MGTLVSFEDAIQTLDYRPPEPGRRRKVESEPKGEVVIFPGVRVEYYEDEPSALEDSSKNPEFDTPNKTA